MSSLPPLHTGLPRTSHSSCRSSTTQKPLVSCCLLHVLRERLSLPRTADYSKISLGRLVSLPMPCISPPTCNARVSAWSPHVKRNAVVYGAICTMGLAQRWPPCTCKPGRFVC